MLLSLINPLLRWPPPFRRLAVVLPQISSIPFFDEGRERRDKERGHKGEPRWASHMRLPQLSELAMSAHRTLGSGSWPTVPPWASGSCCKKEEVERKKRKKGRPPVTADARAAIRCKPTGRRTAEHTARQLAMVAGYRKRRRRWEGEEEGKEREKVAAEGRQHCEDWRQPASWLGKDRWWPGWLTSMTSGELGSKGRKRGRRERERMGEEKGKRGRR